jgi:thioredoxin reductase
VRLHPHVKIVEGAKVRAITGELSADGVVFVRAGQTQRVAVHGAFVALGFEPNSGPVRQIAACDADGFIRVNDAHETSVPGVYAAGDVAARMAEQVLIAIGDGVRAARSAHTYLLAN